MRERTKPQAVGDVLKAVMAGHGLGQGGELAKLHRQWAKAVGASVAAHAQPESLKGGRLTLIVDSHPWMNQLSLLSPGIIEKVNEALGAEEVTELRFHAGKITVPGNTTRREGPPKRRKLTKEEQAEIEEALAPIKDEALREAGRRLLTTAAVTTKNSGKPSPPTSSPGGRGGKE